MNALSHITAAPTVKREPTLAQLQVEHDRHIRIWQTEQPWSEQTYLPLAAARAKRVADEAATNAAAVRDEMFARFPAQAKRIFG